MRRVRYSVAASLDGFIAGRNGEYDWIPMDPDIHFGAMFAQLLDAGVVDDVEVAIVPVLVGGGIPLRTLPSSLHRLTLQEHRLFEKSGIMLLSYEVQPV